MNHNTSIFQFFRQSVCRKVVCVFFAVQLLNMSIDPVDVEPFGMAEDLSINDIESLVELVLEEIIGIENCVAESDERDTDSVKCKVIFSFIITPQEPFRNNQLNAIKVTHIPQEENFFVSTILEEVTPPPRLA